MVDPNETYQSPFSGRYSSEYLLKLFSEKNKIVTWRKLWLILAESEKELGFQPIKQEHLDEMRANLENINWTFQKEKEKEMRHDVMSHVKTFEEACPLVKKAGILHAGATSCYVQDNADLIIIKDAMDFILNKMANLLHRMAKFSEKYKDLATVGRTHYQPATMVTVGKRGAMWAQDVLLAFNELDHQRKQLKYRGAKGATGTRASFLELFDGDYEKVKKLDKLVTGKAGFEKSFTIAGQTYTRQQDVCLLAPLAALAGAVHRICMDLRMLQAEGEIFEPFEKDQIGSSAMPYKRNPMRAERCCGLARTLIDLYPSVLHTEAVQGFERTLDDSSNRRVTIPQAFLCADALLTTLQNIFDGIVVREGKIRQNVDAVLPFLVLETILMKLTKYGESRQEAHEKIKSVAMKAKEISETCAKVDLLKIIDDLGHGAYFEPVKKDLQSMLADPNHKKLIGLCPQDVEEFLKSELEPALEPYRQSITSDKATLTV